MADHWYIVQTNPNCEHKAAREMRMRGFGVHVPRVASVRRHHRTKQQIVKRRPAMAGYIFMRFKGPENWYKMRQCQGVKGVLYIDNRPYRFDQAEVVAIIRAQRSMLYEDGNARNVRIQMRRGHKDVGTAARKAKLGGMSPGRHITAPMSGAERVFARIVSLTKKGTVKAVVLDGEGHEMAVEFTDVDNLELVDDDRNAA